MKFTTIEDKKYIVRQAHTCTKCALGPLKNCPIGAYKCLDNYGTSNYLIKDTWFNRLKTKLDLWYFD